MKTNNDDVVGGRRTAAERELAQSRPGFRVDLATLADVFAYPPDQFQSNKSRNKACRHICHVFYRSHKTTSCPALISGSTMQVCTLGILSET